jgi:general L-amino acid transport system substrate-binding protein
MMIKKILLLVGLFSLFLTVTAFGYTKEAIQKRDFLQCGVSTGSPGFYSVDEQGRWAGLDVDICRALAAATLGDANKVEFLPLAGNEAYTALLGGEIDILSRHSTWTYTRDSALAVHFAGISYYDGQGIMVAKTLGAEKIGDLKMVKVCSTVGPSTEKNLTEYLESSKVEYKIVSFDNIDLAVKGFEGQACDLISMKLSQLYGVRLGLAKPEDALVLSDVITKEPLGPVVRQGDDIWFNIVRWTLFAMLNAEELGINSDNIDEMKISNKLDIKRFFGLEGTGGKGLGLKNDWAAQIIRQVGNYGEVFERNLGEQSTMKIERGMNKLWNQGGLQYAPPFR